ncbi:MAG: hypothetical protein ABI564_10105 [Ideonella sp.]
MRQAMLVDPHPLLATIRAPTLLVWGEFDAMSPIANSADYLKAIPTVWLVKLPTCRPPAAGGSRSGIAGRRAGFPRALTSGHTVARAPTP